MHETLQDPILWLQEFRVELGSASAELYGNARQQAELRLTVQVQPGQPPLTSAQLASLLLVVEQPDGSYQQLPFTGANDIGWWQSPERDTRFDLMPRSASTSPSDAFPGDAPLWDVPLCDAPPNTLVSKLLYVSTAQPGGSNVKLRAMIRKDASTTYYTDRAAGFDHYVTLTTVRPPIWGETDYVWQKTHEDGNVEQTFVHEYSLRPRDLGLASVSSAGVPGMIRWHANVSGETWATFVGMALPGNKTILYDEAIQTGSDFTPSATTVTPGNEALVLVLNGADNIPFYREGLAHGGPCSVLLVDRHGNDHRVQLSFSNEGTALEKRTNIRLSFPTLDALLP